MTTDRLLQQAVAAVKAGDKDHAFELLDQVLQRDPANESAWLWLSGVVDTDAERAECLQEVLSINPDNTMARRGLERLGVNPGRTAPTAAEPFPAPPPPRDSQAFFQSLASPPIPTESAQATTAGPSLTPVEARQAVLTAADAPQPAPSPRPDFVSGRKAPQPTKREPTTSDAIVRALTLVAVLALFGVLGYVGVILLKDGVPSFSHALSSPTATPAPLVWKQWGFEEGGFVVQMPGKPETDVETVNTAAGRIKLHYYTVDFGDTAYFAAYADFPSRVVQNGDVTEMLDGARDGAVANVDGTLRGERHITLQGYPGRELWIEAEFGGVTGLARARIYLVGARLYQLIAGGSEDAYSERNAEQFLN